MSKGQAGVKVNISLQNQQLASGITDLNGKVTFFINESNIIDGEQNFTLTTANRTGFIVKKAAAKSAFADVFLVYAQAIQFSIDGVPASQVNV